MAIRRNLVVLSGRIDWKAEEIKYVEFKNGKSAVYYRIYISVGNDAAEQEDVPDYFYLEFSGRDADYALHHLQVGKYITVEGDCIVFPVKKEKNGETVREERYLIRVREFNASEDLLFYENDIRIIGYLAEDPVLLDDSNDISELTVSVNRRDKTNSTDTFRVLVYGNLVEHVQNNYRRGDAVAVSGRMQPASFENGTWHYNAKIIADSIKNPAGGTSNASRVPAPENVAGCEPEKRTYKGRSLEEVKEALLALKQSPTKETIDELDPAICQNPDFLEGVGSFSIWRNDMELLSHTLAKAIYATEGDRDELEFMRYALAHFYYYRIIDEYYHRYLKHVFIAAQEQNEDQMLPFQPGEYGFEEDCYWDMQKESVRIAIDKTELEQKAVEGKEEEFSVPLKPRVYPEDTDAKRMETPLPETWHEHDVIPSEEDFAWWDNYRNRDGVVDFDLIEDTDYISFAHAKALVLMNPEYITQFPKVPYAPGKVLATNACYGLSDERLFEAIINKHYYWIKQYNSQKVSIRNTEKKLAEENDPSICSKLTAELEALKKELQRLEEKKPANAQRDAMLIWQADRPLKEGNTSAADGEYDCLTKKFATVNPKTFECFAVRARADWPIARPVVMWEPSMLKFAGISICDDAEVIFTSYENNDHDLDVLRFAGKNFFMKHKKAFRGMIEENPGIVQLFARGLLLSEPKFASEAVRWNPLAYQYFNRSVQMHPDVIFFVKDTNTRAVNPSVIKKFLDNYLK